MVRRHCAEGFNQHKVLVFFSLPLLHQTRRIVELGCGFTYYPETYKPANPWQVSSSPHEALVSTRMFLTACRFLRKVGVAASVTSVDIRREPELFRRAQMLLKDMDLLQYWNPVLGTDSIKWLMGQKEMIDLALVDSHHTYDQVAGELGALGRLMSPRGIIIVDDCYDVSYSPGVDWGKDESMDGVRNGGEYGAILDFLKGNSDWAAEWTPMSIASMVVLRKMDRGAHEPVVEK